MKAYIERLSAAGRVRIVEREVSGRHELAAVTQASQRESDAPILFRRVAINRDGIGALIQLHRRPPAAIRLLITNKVRHPYIL